MPHATRSVKEDLLAELGRHDSGSLEIGGVPATSIAERYGTPAYVYDAAILRRRVQALRAALGPRLNILFALKANPNIAVASTLRQAGVGCEVASSGEIHAALAAGFRGPEMQFAGPGKHGEDLTLSLANDLGSLNVESQAEYETIASLARSLAVRPNVAIRVNPKEAMTGSRMRMGGASKKFGVDLDLVPALVQQLTTDDLS